MDFFISNAMAQDAVGGGNPLMGFLPLVIIFVLFYFLLIRPQLKRDKAHREMISKLDKGDEVVSTGGMLGRIEAIDESFITLDVGNNVRIKIQRHAIASVMPKGTLKAAG